VKSLVDHVTDQTFAPRHADLLLTDDSLLDFARRSYPGGITQRMAELQLLYRTGDAVHHPESRAVVKLFVDVVRSVEWVFVARDGTEFHTRAECDRYDARNA
jgi:hypothetical protein